MKRLAVIAAVLLALVVTASAIIEAYGEATSRGAQDTPGTMGGSLPLGWPGSRPVLPGTPLGPESRLRATFGVPTPAQARTAVVGAMVAAQRLRGVASWYATPGLTGAAGPVLRDALGGDPAFRGERVTVCASRCVTVTLTDWCQCPERGGKPTLIDLSDSAFRRLGSLSRGIVPVTIAVGGPVPQVTLPPTDGAP